MNARPEPDFKYFSKLNALYLSLNTINVQISTGKRCFVEITSPLECFLNLLSKSLVHPT